MEQRAVLNTLLLLVERTKHVTYTSGGVGKGMQQVKGQNS